ncbi:MAG TPA: DUF1549 and DUF1553 domain-containing protein [Planctomycetaceae bacterium]|nr:DUF1549 and DUF1553 domain-containing protein [Planctomycetaceae bacterium]
MGRDHIARCRGEGTFAGRRAMAAVLVLLLALAPPVDGAEPGVTETPITAGDREHWSFRPLERPDVPAVANAAWPRNAVDRFVLAKLESAGLDPMPEASRATLIRRLTFDLTGLPPTPEEIDEFAADASPEAHEKLVDRLLASDAYGARWAQHWLDLARFAETDGFEHDLVRPNAWRYRDWVIDALNADLPWDEFVRLQLAGDVLRPGDRGVGVATGFLLCGPDMPDINLQEERRHNFLNDITATVGSVFLGLQIGCAQCHDHKYDPLSQLDFYRLRACFESAEIFGEHAIATPAEQAEHDRRVAGREQRLTELQADVERLEQSVQDRVRRERGEEKRRLSPNELLEHFTADEHRRRIELTAERERLRKERLPELPMGRVVKERSGRLEPSHLWVRGDFRRKGPAIEPAFPRIANPAGLTPAGVPVAGLPRETHSPGTRAALAEWLTRPDNPLAARVLANRLWQHHFVRGLSDTPSDFGVVGDEPTHPELLDWLALEFVRRSDSQLATLNSQPWSFKRFHRLVVNTASYRQASRPSEPGWADDVRQIAGERWRRAVAEDPDNELLSRMRRRRLDGEAIRDTLLAVSNRLCQRRGGPGVRPPLPEELVATLLKNQWSVTPDLEDHARRSIYLFVRRNLRYPLFEVFDGPDTNASCPRRNRSTIAPQALVLLNSELSLAAARGLAGRALVEADGEVGAQIALCYRLVLGREPTAAERDLAVQFVRKTARQLREEGRERASLAVPARLPEATDIYDAAALTGFCLALFNVNEFVYVE